MHLIGQPHKCIKCGHEFKFSIHDYHSAPTTSACDPVCPMCWDKFLCQIGLGYCTVAFTKDGSNYEQMQKLLKEDL